MLVMLAGFGNSVLPISEGCSAPISDVYLMLGYSSGGPIFWHSNDRPDFAGVFAGRAVFDVKVARKTTWRR